MHSYSQPAGCREFAVLYLKHLRDPLIIQDYLLLIAARFGKVDNVSVLINENDADPQSDVCNSGFPICS